MMGWVGSGGDFCGLGWVQKFWVGLGFEKVTHDQLCGGLSWLPVSFLLHVKHALSHTQLYSPKHGRYKM